MIQVSFTQQIRKEGPTYGTWTGEAKPYLSPLAADIRRGTWKPRARGTRKSTSRTAAPTRTAVSFMVDAVADAAFLAAFWDRVITILLFE